MTAPVTPNSRWRHWKGDTVTVLSIVRHSETKDLFVRYEHLGEEWIRPLSMWQEPSEAGQGPLRSC